MSPRAPAGRPAPDATAAWGRAAVAAITVLVGLTWLPSLLGPLGDSHEGRIYGLVSLQVSNLWEMGWSASGWGTSIAPFGDAYSHHPPAFMLWYVPAWQLPGDPTVWVRVVPYLLGLAFLPASAALLVRLGLRWVSGAVAVGLVAATPLYWVYGRIWPALGLVALLAWAIADLRERPAVSGRRLVAVAALAAFTVAANWFAMAAAALLGLWLLAGRGVDRTTVVVGAVMGAAAVATFAWVLLAPDAVEVLQQFSRRTSGGDFTVSEFAGRIGRWLSELLPWWAALAVLGLVAGLARREIRAVAAGSIVLGVGWIVGFSDGAWVHDYWIVSLCLPLVVGLAALVDVLLGQARGGRRTVGMAATGAGAVVGALAVLLAGAVPEHYVTEPRAAGRLVTSVDDPDQPRGWVGRSLPEPIWLGYAWDVPVEALRHAEDVAAVPDDHLVLVELDALPWVDDPSALAGDAVGRDGDYALVTGAVLAEHSR